MVQVPENTMEMHPRKLSELSNEKCKPTGSSDIFHHLKGCGVEISPWMVLADWVIATEVVEDQVNDASGDDKPPERSRR